VLYCKADEKICSHAKKMTFPQAKKKAGDNRGANEKSRSNSFPEEETKRKPEALLDRRRSPNYQKRQMIESDFGSC
jgi:hypothetical protein